MNSFLRMVASAALSLMLVAVVGISFTGCSAETLSGPNIESYAGNEAGGGTSGAGSEHNIDKNEAGGGTSGAGSEHNIDP
jgi:hypothetical protein